jgi:flagellar L-ring protein precursor FlgH
VFGINPNGSTTFNGGGTTAKTQTLVSSGVAVQVIDVLPNGNLVIEGIRQVSFSKERQFATIRGIIRPMDVDFNNTISSSKVADARIDVVSEGALTTNQKKGWLKQLDEKISPY